MSFLMYARPAPVNLPEPQEFMDLKSIIASRWFGHDGSIRSDRITITAKHLDFLYGIATAGAPDVNAEALILIQMVLDNPQGVHVWIGEHDDEDD